MAKIVEMPLEDRPYEKLEQKGAEFLSDSELLAIIIKTGIPGQTSVQLAQKLIMENFNGDNLSFIRKMSIEELTKINGIGRVKAIQLKAVFELANRINLSGASVTKIINSEDAVKLAYSKMRYSEVEEVMIIITDDHGKLLKYSIVSRGNDNSTHVNPREIFKDAMHYSRPHVIIIHNHPSGNPMPSDDDISYTEKIVELSKNLGIVLIDHLIIGDKCYVSFRDAGYIKDEK